MKVKTTVIDRTKPNSWVYTNTNSEKRSETISKRQIKYFAHIARHPDDITHQVCYGPPHLPRQLNAHNRRGRPRHHWTQHTEQLTFKLLRDAGKDLPNRQKLFEECSNIKLMRKLTDKQVPPPVVDQHAGGQRELSHALVD